MQLWLRYRKASALEADEKVNVRSHAEWREVIYNPDLVSSVLWPDKDLYRPDYQNLKRKHPHEKNEFNAEKVYSSYLRACRALAAKLERKYAGSRCLVYAPLRGALPIWRCISQFVRNIEVVVYYTVTSSFVFYPMEFGILGSNQRPASGRFNNRLELARIAPFLAQYDYLLYVDEIVSGGMVRGHLKDMFRMEIHKRIPIVVVGLADAWGERSEANRLIFSGFEKSGLIRDFLCEGCYSLITEDHKYMLGIHYTDYKLGPHIVPVLDEALHDYPEKIQFDDAVSSA